MEAPKHAATTAGVVSPAVSLRTAITDGPNTPSVDTKSREPVPGSARSPNIASSDSQAVAAEIRHVPGETARNLTRLSQNSSPSVYRSSLAALAKRYQAFLACVVAPTVLVAVYLFLIAADQYITKSKFVVRAQNTSASPSILGQGLGGLGISVTDGDTMPVNGFMTSHDAVKALQPKIDIVAMFRRPEADFLSHMESEFTAEDLLAYYQSHVNVDFDSSTGITTLRVRAFRPDDAVRIAETLLGLGEALVNDLNERARADALDLAKNEVALAERRAAKVREALTRFRDQQGHLDPGKSSALQVELVAKLEEQLAQSRTELTELRSYMKSDNPRLKALQIKIAALQDQISDEKSRLTGGKDALAPVIGDYERLLLDQAFADREYASALVSLEAARLEAQRHHLYLTQIVRPNLPDESLYPNRWRAVATVFVGLLLSYGTGWLILAGVREHAG